MVRAALLVLLAGCLESASRTCADGVLCAPGSLCDTANGGCVLPEQLETCAEEADGEVCPITGQSDGVCRNQVCVAARCGDGFRASYEPCDATSSVDADRTTTCEARGFYVGDAPVACVDCQWDVAACSEFCGDHILNGHELCEDTVSIGGSCLDYGFDRGTLGCAFCGPSFDACGVIGWQSLDLGLGVQSAYDLVVDGNDVYLAFAGTFDVAGYHAVGGVVPAGQFPRPAGNYAQLELGVTSGGTLWGLGATSAGATLAAWDGTAWQTTQTWPLSGGRSDLYVVGDELFVAHAGLVRRGDGTSFTDATVTPRTNPRLSGTSPTDVYVTGDEGVAHWDGSMWSDVVLAKPLLGSDKVASPVASVGDTLVVLVWISSTSRFELWTRTAGQWTTRELPFALYDLVPRLELRSADDVYVLVKTAMTGARDVVHWDGAHWTKLEDFPRLEFDTLGKTADGAIVAHSSGELHTFAGSAWSTVKPPGGSLVWTAGGRLYAGGNGVQIFDGSNTWTPMPGSPQNPLLGAGIGNEVYTVSSFGSSIDHFDGTSWSSTSVSISAYRAFAVRATNDVFVSMANGVGHFTNGTLTTEPLNDPNNSNGVPALACNATTCFAISSGGHIFRRDAAPAWTLVDVGFPDNPATGYGTAQSIAVLPDGSVWFGSTTGAVARPDGAAWIVETIAPLEISRLAGSSASDVFALAGVANEFELHRWNGTSWTQVRLPFAFAQLYDLVMHERTLCAFGISSSSVTLGRLSRFGPWY